MTIIGVGNRDRGDDGAGPAVVDALIPPPPGARIHHSQGDAAELLELFSGASEVVVIDAVRSGAPAGAIHRWEVSDDIPPASLGAPTSSHAFGLAQALELGRALDRLPPSLILIGIEGGQWEVGGGLSPPVAAAVDEVARALRASLDPFTAHPPRPASAPERAGRMESPMHEMSLMADLFRKLDRVAKDAGAARILAVKVELGALSHISAAHFREHFEHQARGTVAEGARLEVVELTDAEDPEAQSIRLRSVEVEEG